MQVSARAQRLEPVSFVLSDSSQQRSQHQIQRDEQQREIEGKEVAPGRGAAERVGEGRDPREEGYDGGGVEAVRDRLPGGRPMEAGRALVARLLRIGRRVRGRDERGLPRGKEDGARKGNRRGRVFIYQHQGTIDDDSPLCC